VAELFYAAHETDVEAEFSCAMKLPVGMNQVNGVEVDVLRGGGAASGREYISTLV